MNDIVKETVFYGLWCTAFRKREILTEVIIAENVNYSDLNVEVARLSSRYKRLLLRD